MKKILLVEDDPQQAETIKRSLEHHFYGFSVEVLETESEMADFTLLAGTGQVEIPAFVVSGVMLPWKYPDKLQSPIPEDVVEGTFRRAGTRCWTRFRKHPSLCSVPWIYFTVLDDKSMHFADYRDDLTYYVQKAGSIKPLLNVVGDYLAENPSMVRKGV